MEEPIKSPFPVFKIKEVRTETSVIELAEKGLKGFLALLATLKETGQDDPPEILFAYVTGYIASLQGVGVDSKTSVLIGKVLQEHIMEKGGAAEGCGECDNCKANKK